MKTTVKLKPYNGTIPFLATRIRKISRFASISPKESIEIAKNLITGNEWITDSSEIYTGNDSMFEFQTDKPESNPYQKWFDDAKFYRELLQKGANGDVESAIAYCKAELAGEIGHGCIG